ncbi:HD-GYP domain-containing protein [Geoalkalibacter halelectricus]|uniref:HD-GYP domain-containing protein n=1 Tax=Geoalkalibacter halelectricus TaxID=2847045 RepID=UPI00266F3100|nr:HD domain-containing phosphohydrolase [Geoalkalibacter halelectricus]MDO3380342.1 HD domain-containing protein [Geoalkalibacter halelectricus]
MQSNVSDIRLPVALQTLRKALHAKGEQLYKHSILCAEIARHLADAAEFGCGMTPQKAYCAGLVHDVGKLYIPDAILQKPARLTDSEWELIRLHSIYGVQFVKGTPLEEFSDVIGLHHERPDGNGYPYRRSGSEVTADARLIQVADQTAAILEDRPYRRRIGHPGIVIQELAPTVEMCFPDHVKAMLEALRVVAEQHAHSAYEPQGLGEFGGAQGVMP